MSDNWLEHLSLSLGLQPEAQDWGICNADPSRISEFIKFYEEHVSQHPWEPEALAELILASADDGCRDGAFSAQEVNRIRHFVQEHCGEFPNQWEYWSKLNPREFPVVDLLASEDDGQQRPACGPPLRSGP